MNAKFLAGLILASLAAPALANTPNNNFSAQPSDQPRLAPAERSVGETTGGTLSPFTERARPYGTARPLTGRHGGNFAPPHMDAAGVPDPRI